MIKLLFIFFSFFLAFVLMIVLQKYFIVNTIFLIIGIFFILYVLNEEHEYQAKISWTLIIIISPPLGIILYLVFGKTYKSRRLFKRKIHTDKKFLKYHENNFDYHENSYFEATVNKITKQDATSKNNVTILNNGIEKFPTLLEKIKEAKRYIHLEYYIIHESEIVDEIFTLLKQKAQAGVEVKVLYDGYGCVDLKRTTIKDWIRSGIEVVQFGAIKFSFISDKNLLNYRNHRKIVVIDGQYAFTGGINLGDEYLYVTKKYGFWRDTHVMIEGQAVRDVELLFAKDWYYETGNNFLEDNESFYLSAYNCPINNSHVQVIASGPDHKEFSIKDVYFKLINEAKKEIIIMTPYLVPDQDIITSLTLAAKTGVDVKIIVPGRPDRKIVHAVSRSYYQILLDSGVKVYEMKHSFVHSKVLIIDDIVSSIGTTNIDFRSFHLNFEMSAFIFSKEINQELKNQSQLDLDNCEQINKAEWDKRNILIKTFGNIIQLITPIM